jgi:hypothetical protein
MLTKIVLFLFFFQASPMPHGASSPRRPEDLQAKLRTRVHSYQLQANNFVEALTRVASDFHIPLGIEWVNPPAPRARVSLSWNTATIREVLQAVVKTQPGFKMLVGTSVVHVSSPDLVPDHENPLKLKISAFEVHNATVESASRQLHEVVKRTLFPAKTQQGFRGGVAASGASNVDDPKISVTLKDATVEDILDALALTSARKIWIVTFSDSRVLTSTGFRRTLTLWNDFPIPDDEQPLWDLLHWRDPIPATVLGGR